MLRYLQVWSYRLRHPGEVLLRVLRVQNLFPCEKALDLLDRNPVKRGQHFPKCAHLSTGSLAISIPGRFEAVPSYALHENIANAIHLRGSHDPGEGDTAEALQDLPHPQLSLIGSVLVPFKKLEEVACALTCLDLENGVIGWIQGCDALWFYTEHFQDNQGNLVHTTPALGSLPSIDQAQRLPNPERSGGIGSRWSALLCDLLSFDRIPDERFHF